MAHRGITTSITDPHGDGERGTGGGRANPSTRQRKGASTHLSSIKLPRNVHNYHECTFEYTSKCPVEALSRITPLCKGGVVVCVMHIVTFLPSPLRDGLPLKEFSGDPSLFQRLHLGEQVRRARPLLWCQSSPVRSHVRRSVPWWKLSKSKVKHVHSDEGHARYTSTG